MFTGGEYYYLGILGLVAVIYLILWPILIHSNLSEIKKNTSHIRKLLADIADAAKKNQ